MVPNVARDASTSRNMAVLCQELFELPDVTLTSSLYHSTSPVWLLGFCQATPMSPKRIVSFSGSLLSLGLDLISGYSSLWLLGLNHVGWILDLYHNLGQLI